MIYVQAYKARKSATLSSCCCVYMNDKGQDIIICIYTTYILHYTQNHLSVTILTACVYVLNRKKHVDL